MMIETRLQRPYKHITWECTTVCNYSCSYCWPDCHNGKYRWPTDDQTDKLISYITEFSAGDQIVLDIMGGEPTLWPQLKKFCSLINNFSSITFSTNGSRTLNYWKNFDAPIDHLLFSFHPEFASVEHFIKILKEIQDRFHITVLILYHPDYLDKCENLFNCIDIEKIRVNVSYKFIQFTHPIETSDRMKNNIIKTINRSVVQKSTISDTEWFLNNKPIDPNVFIKQRQNIFLN